MIGKMLESCVSSALLEELASVPPGAIVIEGFGAFEED